MPKVIAYYDASTLIVRDLDPYSTGDEIPAKPGMTARIVQDYAVAVGWKWDDAAEGFVPVPVADEPPVDPFDGMGAAQIIAAAQTKFSSDLTALRDEMAAALAAAADKL